MRRQYIIWSVTLSFLFFLGGLCGAFISGQMGLWNRVSTWIDFGPSQNRGYLKPSSNDWTPFVDNHLPNIIQQGDPSSPKIALTFDDGPERACTDTILSILHDFHVKATFFLVGSQAEKYPDQTRRIFHEGHEIANHTYSHIRLNTLRPGQVVEELEKTRTVLFNLTGVIPILFRPPGGRYKGLTLELANELKYSTVFWTNNAGDWQTMPVNVLVQKVVEHTAPGAIILLHNSDHSSTIAALPTILKTLKRQGYQFVTVSELVEKPRILSARK